MPAEEFTKMKQHEQERIGVLDAAGVASYIQEVRNRKSTASKRPPMTSKVELGEYIVADPEICHGKVTFKGTRIFIADVLEDLERGDSWAEIIHRWGEGKLTRAAIAEALQLARRAFIKKDGRLSALRDAA